METPSFVYSFTTESVIAILGVAASIVIAIIGGIYAVITNTKKYELTENYRKELLEWYTKVVTLMIKIIHCIESETFFTDSFSSQREDTLSQLSALVETGRFYFPNIIKKDRFGSEKPLAYQGYRHLYLEFVLHFYRIAYNSVDCSDASLLWKLEREFTSGLFEMIEPRKRNRDYSKYLAITIPKGKTIEDYYL